MKKVLISIAVLIAGCSVRDLQAPSEISPVKPSEIQELRDGQSYDLPVQMAIKEEKGISFPLLTYGGMFPGPTFRVDQGSSVTLKVQNQITFPTLLHSHGLRLDNAFDGTHLVQKEILPGETFSYQLRFPDAGIYWYHPHLREDFQQEQGLYGAYLVAPKDPAYWSKVNREEVLILDDLLINKNGIADFHPDFSDHALMGRFGNVLLVNGKKDYQLSVKKNEVVRLFILNAANTRVFQLIIPDLRMKLVGGDNGRIEEELWTENIVIAPSQRQIVEVLFQEAGNFSLLHQTPYGTKKLGSINVAEESVVQNYSNSFQTLRKNSVDFLEARKIASQFLEKNPDKTLRTGLSFEGGHGMHMMMAHEPEKIEWEDTMGMMNSAVTSEMVKWKLIDEESKKENDDIPWVFQKNSWVKLRLVNDEKILHPMQHPLHIHGQRMIVLSTNGEETDSFQFQDTVLLQTGDSMDILVEMSNQGKWMFHCHIPEHLESGMSVPFTVL